MTDWGVPSVDYICAVTAGIYVVYLYSKEQYTPIFWIAEMDVDGVANSMAQTY